MHQPLGPMVLLGPRMSQGDTAAPAWRGICAETGLQEHLRFHGGEKIGLGVSDRAGNRTPLAKPICQEVLA